MFLSNGQVIPAQVDTLADRTPLFADAFYHASSVMPLAGLYAAYSALYKEQLWIGIVIRKLAMGQARLPFDCRLGDPTSSQPEGGNLADLMARPNPRLSGFKLWQWTSSTYDIYGEAFWLKLRDNNGRVRELHPIHPTNLVTKRTAEGVEYVYTSGSANTPLLPAFPEADVVAFTNYNPDNLERGLSNLEGLRMTLLNEDAARRANASWWKRGARPGVVLEHPEKMREGAVKRLRKQWDDIAAGADAMGGTVVLEEGMKANIIQLNAEEMQYIESRKLNREEVCSAYDVPPPAVHILDHATFSNITEQLRSMYRDTMAPRSEFFESVVDHQLVPDFYGTGTAFTRFNMDEVLRGDFEVRAEAVSKLIGVGLMRPNEGRGMFNLPPAGAEADVLYGNAALVPLGSNTEASQPIGTNGEPIPQPVALPAPKAPLAIEAGPAKTLSVRAIMGSLARVKDSRAAMREKLVEAHARELKGYFTRQLAGILAARTQKALSDSSTWDDELAGILATLAAATSQAVGTKTAVDLNGKYDTGRIASWITENAAESAAKINQVTASGLGDYLAAQEQIDGEAFDIEASIRAYYEGPVMARADQISTTRVAVIASLAGLVAAEQSGAKTKTWMVTSDNARPSHSAMDGETVELGKAFSNGMNGPGDPTGGADEVAGCTCDLVFGLE